MFDSNRDNWRTSPRNKLTMNFKAATEGRVIRRRNIPIAIVRFEWKSHVDGQSFPRWCLRLSLRGESSGVKIRF
jgi:hypothetical protein